MIYLCVYLSIINRILISDILSCNRLSKKLRDGSLKEGEDLQDAEDLENCSEPTFDDSAVGYQTDLQAEVTSVVQLIEVDQWVIVIYDQQWYPGCVSEVIIFYCAVDSFVKLVQLLIKKCYKIEINLSKF